MLVSPFTQSFGGYERFEAIRRGQRREAYCRDQIERALRSKQLAPSERDFLKATLFDPPTHSPLLVANAHVRTASRNAFIKVICDLFEDDPSRKLYLVTAAGARSVRTLSDPGVDLVPLQRAIDKTLRRRLLTGVLAFEFDIVVPKDGASDYPVLWHSHGIVGREDGKAIGLADTRRAFAASRAFPPWNGAVGLHIVPIKRTMADIARVAAYLADPFHQLKLRYPHPDLVGRKKMKGTRSGYPPAVILRALEIQTQLRLFDTVFGVGPLGTRLRDRWSQAVQLALPVAYEKADFVGPALEELFARINAQHSDFAFQPPRITTRSNAKASARPSAPPRA
jgi:hypothetical protein